MRIIWNIHTETKSKEKAEKNLFKVAEALNVETGPIFVEKKGDGGCLCVFSHNLKVKIGKNVCMNLLLWHKELVTRGA